MVLEKHKRKLLSKMIILCDTREQSPLQFVHAYVESTEKRGLDVGDYGAILKDGHEIPIIFERKSIPDAVGTFSKGYKRFYKEIQRSQTTGKELIIIIEGTVTDLIRGTQYSKVQGLQILRTLLSLWNKYKIISVFCRDREEMSLFIVEYYMAYARKRVKEIKNNATRSD